MAIYDRWYLTRRAPDGSKIRSGAYGCTNRWQVRYRDLSGSQRKRNFAKKEGKDANKHAAAFDAKIRSELDAGTYIDPDAGQVTLRSRAQLWRRGLTSDPQTLAQLDSRLNKWLYPSEIADKPMIVLSQNPSMVQQWIKSMEPHLAASTINGIVSWVSTIFNAALDDSIIGKNPFHAKSVQAPAVTDKEIVPWTLGQVQAASEALPARLAALPVLGAGCGHRQGEAFGIALEDIDFLGRVVAIRRQVRLVGSCLYFSPPKRRKIRSVPLSDAVGLRLSAHIAAYPPVEVELPWLERGRPNAKPVKARLLFTTPKGGALDRNQFNRLWRAARVAAGAPDTRENGFHAMRHTYASANLADLVDIRTLAAYLGHTDPGFTLRVYGHMMPNAADRARKAVDSFFQASALNVPSAEAE